MKLRRFFVVSRDRSILLSCVLLRGTYLWSFRVLRGLRMSLCGLVKSVFWHRKLFSYWPLPQLSVLVSSTLCRTESLIPGTGVRFPFLLSWVSWPRLRIPLPLLLGLRAFLYRPCQTREIIAMGDYVLCGQSGFTLTALLHIVRNVNGSLSPQGVARRRLRRPRSASDLVPGPWSWFPRLSPAIRLPSMGWLGWAVCVCLHFLKCCLYYFLEILDLIS